MPAARETHAPFHARSRGARQLGEPRRRALQHEHLLGQQRALGVAAAAVAAVAAIAAVAAAAAASAAADAALERRLEQRPEELACGRLGGEVDC